MILPPDAPVADDWTLEDFLDVDAVSAICPDCRGALGLGMLSGTSPSIAP